MASEPKTDEGGVSAIEAVAVAAPETVVQISQPEADKAPLADEPAKAEPRKVAVVAKPSGAKPIGISKPVPLAKPDPAAKPIAVTKPARKASKTTTAIKAKPVKLAATGATKRAPAALRPVAAAAIFEPIPEPMKETKMSTIMPDLTESMSNAVGELQSRSKAAYEKSTEMMTDVSASAKGHVEAVVESGKIFSTGMQDLAKAYVEDAKSAYEQMTADLKEMATIKSPTELLQIQGKILRRNFDAVVASSSKNTEKMMKLSNDAFAPISARLSVAAEKLTKVN